MELEMKKLEEINMRMIRTESRLVQLGDHVGANLRTKMRIEVFFKEDKQPYVEVDALDVSMSRVVTSLHEAGVRIGAVPVYLNGELLATIHPGIVTKRRDHQHEQP